MSRSADRRLNDRLERLGADRDRRLSAEELAEIVDAVAGAGPAAALAALAGVAGGADGGQLAALHRELGEIRKAMQDATETFLSMAEAVEQVASHPDIGPGDQAELVRSATAIYEASGFQDTAGQRMTRLADALRRLELSVVAAQAALGDQAAASAARALSGEVVRAEKRNMEHILHGPQSTGTANTQEEIDRVLASFD